MCVCMCLCLALCVSVYVCLSLSVQIGGLLSHETAGRSLWARYRHVATSGHGWPVLLARMDKSQSQDVGARRDERGGDEQATMAR